MADFSDFLSGVEACSTSKSDTSIYIAPELISAYQCVSDYLITSVVDIWSLGVTIYELGCNSKPFNDYCVVGVIGVEVDSANWDYALLKSIRPGRSRIVVFMWGNPKVL